MTIINVALKLESDKYCETNYSSKWTCILKRRGYWFCSFL